MKKPNWATEGERAHQIADGKQSPAFDWKRRTNYDDLFGFPEEWRPDGKQRLDPDNYVQVTPIDSGTAEMMGLLMPVWTAVETIMPNPPLPPGLVWVQSGGAIWLEKQTTHKESL